MSNGPVEPGNIYRLVTRLDGSNYNSHWVVVERSDKYAESWVLYQIGHINPAMVMISWDRENALLDENNYERVA